MYQLKNFEDMLTFDKAVWHRFCVLMAHGMFCDWQLSVEQQLSDSHQHCEQLSGELCHVKQELGQVKDELTSEKQLRLNVCARVYLFISQLIIIIINRFYSAIRS